jgi:cyclopropane fatty-acyl-phospholipid synthase-like methyltransferase
MSWGSLERGKQFQTEFPFNQEEVRASLAILELEDTDYFIDFGSGCGHHVFEAAKVAKEAWGIDGSPSLVEYAREFNKDNSNVTIKQFAFQGLKICAGYFTKGFARNALTYLQENERREFLSSVSIGFADGGWFLLEDVILFPGWEQAVADFKANLPGISMPACLTDPVVEARKETYPFDSMTLEANFSAVGFQLHSIESTCPGYGRALFQKQPIQYSHGLLGQWHLGNIAVQHNSVRRQPGCLLHLRPVDCPDNLWATVWRL